MSNVDTTLEKQIEELEAEIAEKKNRLVQLKKTVPEVQVKDYVFRGRDGNEVCLSELFNHHDELIVVHNMGKRCSYCTLWADGFNGVVHHLERRAAFVVSTPDDVETQQRLATERGWKFQMVSTKGTSFTHDMGFEPEPRSYGPGVTTFRKAADCRIYRGAQASFGPGDDFCSVWHLFDLLTTGVNGWEPDFSL